MNVIYMGLRLMDHLIFSRKISVLLNIIQITFNEKVGFKRPTTRYRNNSISCGALLSVPHSGLPVLGGAFACWGS